MLNPGAVVLTASNFGKIDMATQNQADATAALAAQASAAGAGQPEAAGTQPAGADQSSAGVSGTKDAATGDTAAPVAGSTAAGADGDKPAVVRKLVRARVLVDGRFGQVDDVVQVDDDELRAAGGELCAHPASVAYALSRK